MADSRTLGQNAGAADVTPTAAELTCLPDTSAAITIGGRRSPDFPQAQINR